MTVRVLFLISFLSLRGLADETIRVGPAEQFTEIQRALDAAKDGDTVLVQPGDYEIVEPLDFNRLRRADNPNSPPPKNLKLKSVAGAEATIIRMGYAPVNSQGASVIVFENGETAASSLGFTLTGGKG